MPTLIKAVKMADQWHQGQKRKYHGEPYIEHPLRVMTRVMRTELPGHPLSNAMSAVLHDVVEDCGVTVSTIINEFGADVGMLVEELTNVYTPKRYPKLNRATRKRYEVDRLTTCRPETRGIKLIDRIDNLKCCNTTPVENMGSFATVYAKESRDLAIALGHTFPILSKELMEEALKLSSAARKLPVVEALQSNDPCYGCWQSASTCHICPNGGP